MDTTTGYKRPPLELATLPTIKDALQDYALWLRSRKLSPRSIETYRKDLVRFTTWLETQLGDAPSVGDITAERIEAFEAHLSHLKATTMIKALSAIKSFITWCIRQKLRMDDPTREIIWPKKQRPLPRALSQGELSALEAALASPLPPYSEPRRRRMQIRERLALTLLLYTGARRAEAVNIHWRDVDLDRRVLAIVDGKGGKSRTVPIHDRLYAALDAVPVPHRVGYVLSHEDGRQLHHNALGHMFDRDCAWLRTEWGLHGVSCHRLRHTFATSCAANGVDMPTLAALLGHADIKETQRYIYVSGQQTRQAIEKLPDLFAGTADKKPTPRQIEHTCDYCGEPFVSRSRATRFCSQSCKRRFYREHGPVDVPTHCATCRAPLTPSTRGPKRRFCSERCQRKRAGS